MTTTTADPQPATAVPPPPAAAVILPLAQLAESPTNPRQRYGDLTELIDSIRRQGVLQPVLARPLDQDRYELVFGHRRFRAAREAGLTALPAMVREMTDLEVLEAQLVENCQRVDIHPLDEAEGYRRLHEEHGYSVDDIAAKVGKSKAAVYARLKLCSLAPAARKAFLEERLSPSVALLVARIPDRELQDQATKELTRGADFRPMSVREAEEFIQENYMLRLAEAPFDPKDAELLANAGPCTTCPKRTGNQALLFPDVKSADVCTDPVCFDKKAAAAWARRVETAKAAGQEVLPDKKCRQLFPYGDGRLAYDTPFIDLHERCPVDPKNRHWRNLIGKQNPPTILARDADGNSHELVKREDAAKALKEAGYTWAKGRTADGTTRPRDPSFAKQQQKAKESAEVVRRAIVAVLEAAAGKALDRAWWRLMLRWLVEFSWSDAVRQIVKRRGLKTGKRTDGVIGKDNEGALLELVDNADEAELQQLLLELVVTRGGYVGNWSTNTCGDALVAACAFYGVDLKAITSEVRAAKPGRAKKSAHKDTTPAVRRGRKAAKTSKKSKRANAAEAA